MGATDQMLPFRSNFFAARRGGSSTAPATRPAYPPTLPPTLGHAHRLSYAYPHAFHSSTRTLAHNPIPVPRNLPLASLAPHLDKQPRNAPDLPPHLPPHSQDFPPHFPRTSASHQRPALAFTPSARTCVTPSGEKTLPQCERGPHGVSGTGFESTFLTGSLRNTPPSTPGGRIHSRIHTARRSAPPGPVASRRPRAEPGRIHSPPRWPDPDPQRRGAARAGARCTHVRGTRGGDARGGPGPGQGREGCAPGTVSSRGSRRGPGADCGEPSGRTTAGAAPPRSRATAWPPP